MPHPEHAVEDAHRPERPTGSRFFTSVLKAVGRRHEPRHRRATPQTTPDVEQPYAELGLKDDEYERIRDDPRPPPDERRAGDVLASCGASTAPTSSSKVHLRQFGDKAPQTDALLVGIGENAGVVDIGEGYAVTFKVESHNHPRYVEPYQGAATGVGGIVRDILTMGARPVAVMDPLRFGAGRRPRHPPRAARRRRRHRRLRQLPRPAQHRRRGRLRPVATPATRWSTRCASGVMRHEDIQLAKASGVGNMVVLFGARTGGDGIGGVSRAGQRDLRRRRARAKRPSVQVGDPFTEKLLIEAASRSSRPTSSSASRTSAAPGSPARPPSSRPAATAACTSSSTACRCATRRSRPRRS